MLTEVENIINALFGDFKEYEEKDGLDNTNTLIQE